MTISTTDEGVRALVAELDRSGNLPAGLGPLLEAVPREHFIQPRVWVKRKPIDRATAPEEWLRAVYTDVSIVTQYDDGRAQWPEPGDFPTCSASQPSVVLEMLHQLRVTAGISVLEIGTGTGFNAALLAEMVGRAGSVTTMEVDDALASQADKALAATGHDDVEVIPFDGTFGAAVRAPFDRVIATAAVPVGHVPYAWVEQTRPGGLIVAPVRAPLSSGPLVRFLVNDDGTATGETLPMGVAFMESRAHRAPDVPEDLPEWDQGTIAESVTNLPPWPLLDTPSPRWALAVAMPNCRAGILTTEQGEGHKQAWFRDPVTRSWASVWTVSAGKYRVRQAGIRRLWDEAEAAYRWWRTKGEPSITDWKWTITPDSQSITLA